MLTYIPVKNCCYIVVSFQVVISSLFWTHIQYMGHDFIGPLTHAAHGVLIYSKYLCLAILSVVGIERLSLRINFLFINSTLSAI